MLDERSSPYVHVCFHVVPAESEFLRFTLFSTSPVMSLICFLMSWMSRLSWSRTKSSRSIRYSLSSRDTTLRSDTTHVTSLKSSSYDSIRDEMFLTLQNDPLMMWWRVLQQSKKRSVRTSSQQRRCWFDPWCLWQFLWYPWLFSCVVQTLFSLLNARYTPARPHTHKRYCDGSRYNWPQSCFTHPTSAAHEHLSLWWAAAKPAAHTHALNRRVWNRPESSRFRRAAAGK